MSSFAGSRNSWLSSDFSSPPNTRCRRCGFASSSAFASGGVMDHIPLSAHGDERDSARWPLPSRRGKRKRPKALGRSGRRRRDGGAKALDEPGRSRIWRRKERAAADLTRIVAQPLPRGVDQARARFLEQEIGGGNVPVVR